MTLYQLIPNAFSILSDSYARIGELASEAVRLGDANSPKQPKVVNQLIEVGALYDSVFELVILNDDGDAIVGLNTDADTVNKLLLCLKEAAGLNDLSEFPTPLTVLNFDKCCGGSFPVGGPGAILVSDGDEYIVLEKGPDGSVLTSTPTGLVWSNVVGNGLPAGGVAGQYLRKESNTSYDVVWDTLSLSKITDVTASAAEVNKLDGATVTTVEINYLSGVTGPIQSQLNGKLSSTLPTGQFWVGVSNVATPVTPAGDVTFNTSGVFQITAGVIVDADINSTAAITRSKLANGAANRLVVNSSIGVMTDAAAINPNQVLISDLNGIPTHSGTSATTLSYLDVSSSVQGSLNTKLTVNLSTPAQGDLIQFNGTEWVNFPIGLNGQVLTSNGSSAIWASSVANGVPSGGTANQILRKISSTDYDTEWHTLVLADITNVSATFNEINALSGLNFASVNATQFNYLSGLNSNAQNQIDNKLSRSLNHNSLFVGDAGNIAVMLAPGNEDYILRIVAGVPTWSPETPPGNVSGVSPSTDNAIVRWNGTAADSIQNSGIIIDDSDNITGVTNLTIKTAGALRTATSSGNTLLIQAYDVDGTAYTTFATLTAGNTPTFDLSDSVTKAGQYIYRSGGTDVSLADGGTGASLTDPNADRILFWDESAGAVTWLTVGSNLSITGTTLNATGGGSSLQQKTEPGTTYLVTDADNGYIIYFTSVTGCTVTLSNTVSTNISFTGVRADGAGVITFTDDGTSVLFTINDQFTIDYEKGSASWVKNTTTDWYGWGALGTSGGGGSVNSVSGTTNRITVSGTSTDPVIDIAATYIGQSSITTLGTIGTGVWQGTVVGTTYGGTGLSSIGTSGQLIRVNAGATALEYFTPSYITGNQTITLSGDVTGSGTTSITTLIANNAVTTSKILNSNVTYGKIQNGAALSVLGVTGNSAAALNDISAASDNTLLRRSGTSLTFGTIGNAYITDLAFSKLSGLPTNLSGYGIIDGWRLGGNTLTSTGIFGDLSSTGYNIDIYTKNVLRARFTDATTDPTTGNLFTIFSATGTNAHRFTNTGIHYFGTDSSGVSISPCNASGVSSLSGNGLRFSTNGGGFNAADSGSNINNNYLFRIVGTRAATTNSLNGKGLQILSNITNSSATSITFEDVAITSTINLTGGNLTYRGFYHNPTLTNTTGLTHIAFENVSGQLRFGAITQDDTKTQVLVKDASTNQVFWRDSSTLGGGGISGSGTSGQITYWNGTSSVTSEAGFEYDATNNRMTVNEIYLGNPAISGAKTISVQSSDTDADMLLLPKGTNGRLRIGVYSSNLSVYGDNGGDDLNIEQLHTSSNAANFNVRGKAGLVGTNNGGDVALIAGSAYSVSGNGNGGDALIQSGQRRTSGVGNLDGRIILNPLARYTYTTRDIVIDDSAQGLVLKDTSGVYWRFITDTSGNLTSSTTTLT